MLRRSGGPRIGSAGFALISSRCVRFGAQGNGCDSMNGMTVPGSGVHDSGETPDELRRGDETRSRR